MTNIMVRNIEHGVARNITFSFSAPLECTSGYDITEMPYFQHGINFMAPQTSLPAVWDSYQNVVKNLRYKGLTNGITITSYYDRGANFLVPSTREVPRTRPRRRSRKLCYRLWQVADGRKVEPGRPTYTP
jgi:hypothetical protein